LIKIISVVGARPNFMKVAPLHRAFSAYKDRVSHLIVHTGQHYDYSMSDAFFKDLEMPQPAYFLGAGSGTHAEQTARIILEFEKVLIKEKPDFVIVVGDVNSTIACSLTSVKLGIATAHVEGGLRSGDRTMPEEINRLATDAICDYCFVTEYDAEENLKKEGFPEDRIFFTGNTMIDSQHYAMAKAKESQILDDYGLNKKDYVLVTLHRPSNVDNKEQLAMLIDVFKYIGFHKKIVFPAHPRTTKNIKNFRLESAANDMKNLLIKEPVGYIDFLSLTMNSAFVITDSGGIQEETTALGIPCITLRTTTERPITCEIGTNELVMPDFDKIIRAIDKVLSGSHKKGDIPKYWDGRAAERIAKIIVEDIFKG